MYCFKKLKLNSDFRRIYGRGTNHVDSAFVVYALKNRSGDIRLGLSVGKKLGGAVMRNRAKRILTAAFYECAPHIRPGYDFVLAARTRIFSVKSTEVAERLMKYLQSAGLTKE